MTKAPIDFNMKDWRNSGVYIILVGLVIIFLGKDLKVGGGLFLVGFVFTLLFQGRKIFKIFGK